jgi:hypothetical protein
MGLRLKDLRPENNKKYDPFDINRRLLWDVADFLDFIIVSSSDFALLYFYNNRCFVSNLLIKYPQNVMLTCYNDLLIINL